MYPKLMAMQLTENMGGREGVLITKKYRGCNVIEAHDALIRVGTLEIKAVDMAVDRFQKFTEATTRIPKLFPVRRDDYV